MQLPAWDLTVLGNIIVTAIVTFIFTSILTGLWIFRKQKLLEAKLAVQLHKETNYYDKSAEVVRDLYGRYSNIHEALRRWSHQEMDKTSFATSIETGYAKIKPQVDDFYDFFNANKLYLPSSLNDLLPQFHSAVLAAITSPAAIYFLKSFDLDMVRKGITQIDEAIGILAESKLQSDINLELVESLSGMKETYTRILALPAKQIEEFRQLWNEVQEFDAYIEIEFRKILKPQQP